MIIILIWSYFLVFLAKKVNDIRNSESLSILKIRYPYTCKYRIPFSPASNYNTEFVLCHPFFLPMHDIRCNVSKCTQTYTYYTYAWCWQTSSNWIYSNSMQDSRSAVLSHKNLLVNEKALFMFCKFKTILQNEFSSKKCFIVMCILVACLLLQQ